MKLVWLTDLITMHSYVIVDNLLNDWILWNFLFYEKYT